jgi:acyl-CoA synthetase (NDP forming)
MTMTREAQPAGHHGGLSREAFAGAFAPRAVTVVGGSPGAPHTEYLLRNLLWRDECRLQGPLQFINRSRKVIGGIQSAASSAELEGEPGLVIFLIPTGDVRSVLDGFKTQPQGVVVFGHGAEMGELEAQRELVAWSLEHNIPLFGPQSVGFASFATRTFALIDPIPEPPRLGGVALVTQSGSLISSVMRALIQRDVGIHTAVAVGSSAVVNYHSVGTYLLGLPEVDVLGMYIEDIRDPVAFAGLGRLGLKLGKPVIVDLGASSSAGRMLARSHTGALATDRRVIEGIAHQYGILLVADTDELVWALEALSTNAGRGVRPGGVGIYSQSGGGAVVMADALESAGVLLPNPTLFAQTMQADGRRDGSFNPFDSGAASMRGDTGKLMAAFASDPSLSVLVYCAAAGFVAPNWLASERDAEIAFVKTVHAEAKLPMIVVPAAQGGSVRVSPEVQWPEVPLAFGAKEAVGKLRALSWWANRPREGDLPNAPMAMQPREGAEADSPSTHVLAGPATRAMLDSLPVDWPDEAIVSSAAETEAVWSRLEGPLVAKADAGMAHRAIEGGVVLGIKTRASLRAATEFLLTTFGSRVTIARFVAHDVEYVLGYHLDPYYGALFMFGLGGRELGAKLEFRASPLGRPTIDRLVASCVGDRGLADQFKALIEALEVVVLNDRTIRSIDMNPIVVGPALKIVALDVKIHQALDAQGESTK